jgi:hypothetical protein
VLINHFAAVIDDHICGGYITKAYLLTSERKAMQVMGSNV